MENESTGLHPSYSRDIDSCFEKYVQRENIVITISPNSISKPQKHLFILIDTTKYSNSVKKYIRYLFSREIILDESLRSVNELVLSDVGTY
jgi:hypothetical protein